MAAGWRGGEHCTGNDSQPCFAVAGRSGLGWIGNVGLGFRRNRKCNGMHQRKQALLRLMHLAGGSIDRLRLVKLMFLHAREPGVPPTRRYDFVPYRQGPFSFAMYRDLRSLVESGLATDEGEHEIGLTPQGSAMAIEFGGSAVAAEDRVHARWEGRTTSELIDHVYGVDRWFTQRSDRSGGRYKRAMPVAARNVYTVGYQGLSIDGFLNLLLRRGIQVLVDIRHVPMSRVYGFHSSTLGRHCTSVGIEYLSERDLGVPKGVREAYWSTGDHGAFKAAYSEIVRRNVGSMKRVAGQMRESATAVMCVEASAHECHRRLLAAALVHETGLDWVELRDE